MGKKAKTSRKGKKAWRANISTDDIHDFFEQSTKDALSGGSLASAPAESLFFEDKSKDLSVKRKIEKHRQKVLHVESMLQKNPFVQPVPSSTLKKSKKAHKKVPEQIDESGWSPERSVSSSGMADLWGYTGDDNKKTKKTRKPSIIPAVEVEPPGSSFNPTFESHQETLAHAVAEEMGKVYKKELGPQPVPLTVPGEAVDEEEMYFLEADEGSDDNMNPENLDENGDAASEKMPLKTKRVTTVILNKRARRKEQLKKEEESFGEVKVAAATRARKGDMGMVVVISLPFILFTILLGFGCYFFGRARGRKDAIATAQVYGMPAPPPGATNSLPSSPPPHPFKHDNSANV